MCTLFLVNINVALSIIKQNLAIFMVATSFNDFRTGPLVRFVA